MKHIRVFAPGTVANLGCGFDVMGLTLDGVGDLLEIGAEEGAEGLEIRNLSGMNLPENIEENVITPALRAMLAAYGRPVRIEVTMLEKIAPGSGIGSARPRRPPPSTGSTNCSTAPSRARSSWSSP